MSRRRNAPVRLVFDRVMLAEARRIRLAEDPRNDDGLDE
jgi:hypothetical protein